MKEITCKLLVIGAGPGGYACAIRAGQLGIDTVIVERRRPGGTCLTVGCIPSKALIHVAETFHAAKRMAEGKGMFGIKVQTPDIDLGAAIDWKDGIVGRLSGGVTGLLQRARVKILHGTARFRDGKTVEVETETGMQMVRAEALALREVPRRLVVVGGGYIGLELGTAFAKLGTEVTVVEATRQLLPQYDEELVKPVMARLDRLGIRVLLGASAEGLAPDGAGIVVRTDKETQTLAADRILVTVGRRPSIDGWGIEELDLDRAGRFIRIDDRCRTSMRGVFAIGDVTGEPMLAHRAMAQGEMVAEIVSGAKRVWDKRCIPAVCFTDPQIVSAGLSPAEARAQGLDVKVARFPFAANGRALTTGEEEGFVRIVARADNHLVLGVQAVGAEISELSAAFALSIEMGARLEDIAGTIHAHPTRSEAFQEAAFKALGHALHI